MLICPFAWNRLKCFPGSQNIRFSALLGAKTCALFFCLYSFCPCISKCLCTGLKCCVKDRNRSRTIVQDVVSEIVVGAKNVVLRSKQSLLMLTQNVKLLKTDHQHRGSRDNLGTGEIWCHQFVIMAQGCKKSPKVIDNTQSILVTLSQWICPWSFYKIKCFWKSLDPPVFMKPGQDFKKKRKSRVDLFPLQSPWLSHRLLWQVSVPLKSPLAS